MSAPEIGAPLLEGYAPRLLAPDLYFDDGGIRDEVYVWGSFQQSRMYAAGVRCSNKTAGKRRAKTSRESVGGSSMARNWGTSLRGAP